MECACDLVREKCELITPCCKHCHETILPFIVELWDMRGLVCCSLMSTIQALCFNKPDLPVEFIDLVDLQQ